MKEHDDSPPPAPRAVIDVEVERKAFLKELLGRVTMTSDFARKFAANESHFQSWLSDKLIRKHLAQLPPLAPSDQEIPYSEPEPPKMPRDLRGENPFSDPPYYDEDNNLITGDEDEDDAE